MIFSNVFFIWWGLAGALLPLLVLHSILLPINLWRLWHPFCFGGTVPLNTTPGSRGAFAQMPRHDRRPRIRRLHTGDVGLFGSMLDMFGKAFGNPRTYRAARPGLVHGQQVLSCGEVVILVAIDGKSLPMGLLPMNCPRSGWNAWNSTSMIRPSRRHNADSIAQPFRSER